MLAQYQTVHTNIKQHTYTHWTQAHTDHTDDTTKQAVQHEGEEKGNEEEGGGGLHLINRQHLLSGQLLCHQSPSKDTI